MRKPTLTFLLLIIAPFAFSQTNKSIISLRQLTDSIDTILKKEHVAGMMLGITTKDTVIFSGGFGYADIESGRLADETTLFRMGSVTKMFVALAIMQLIEEGKFKLNDELKKIAPEVPFQNKWETNDPVRIINLLEHTSGFDDFKFNQFYTSDSSQYSGFETMIAQQHSMVCRWKPGERYAYSNPNYAILGYLIEKFSHKSYDRFLTEIILDPLFMLSSNFNRGSNYPDKDTKEYIVKNGKPVSVNSVTLLCGPEGALWSNANDMLKFIQLFLNNGYPLFSENTFAEIELTHSSLAAQFGQHNGYALANINTFFPKAKYSFRGHEGVMGTCLSSCKYNRVLGVGYVLSSNSSVSNYAVEDLIISFLEQNLSSPILETQPIDKKKLTPYLGRYQFNSPRFSISAFSDKWQDAPEIYFRNEQLYFKSLFGKPIQLIQTAPLTFTQKGMNMPLICFTKNSEGNHVMMIEGKYYEQTSNFNTLFGRFILMLALLISVSYIIFAIVIILGVALGKIKLRVLIIRLIPIVGFTLLVWAILILLDVQQYSYKLIQFSSMNFQTLMIFLGPTIFAIISILSLCYAIMQFRGINAKWLKYYLLISSISFCIITVALWQSHWIGLRIWTL